MPDLVAWSIAVALAAGVSCLIMAAGSLPAVQQLVDRAAARPVFAAQSCADRQELPRRASCRTAWAVLGVVAGALVGLFWLELWPHWPPRNALDRLLTLVLPLAITASAIGSSRPWSRQIRLVLRLLLAIAIVRILLHGSIHLRGGSVMPASLIIGWAGLLCLAQAGLLSLFYRMPSRSSAGLLVLVLAAGVFTAGLLVMLAGYLKGGMSALPWVGALTGTACGYCFGNRRDDGGGVVEVGIVVLFGLLFIGRFFGGLTSGGAVLILLTPLLAWVPEFPQFRQWRGWQRDLLRCALVALIFLAVLDHAKQVFDREMGPLVGRSSAR